MGQFADDIIYGRVCSDCGTFFEKEHGYPVLCSDCFEADQWDKDVEGKLPKSTISEL